MLYSYLVCNAVIVAAMESVLGFITVLPGAFSAYRWDALQGEPLNAYFYVEEHSVKAMGPFLANMYLAEDRVSDLIVFLVMQVRVHVVGCRLFVSSWLPKRTASGRCTM